MQFELVFLICVCLTVGVWIDFGKGAKSETDAVLWGCKTHVPQQGRHNQRLIGGVGAAREREREREEGEGSEERGKERGDGR